MEMQADNTQVRERKRVNLFFSFSKKMHPMPRMNVI